MRHIIRRASLAASAAAGVTPKRAALALADWPAGWTIKIVVGFPAVGAQDIAGRIVAGGGGPSTAEFAAFVGAERAKWGRPIADLKIKEGSAGEGSPRCWQRNRLGNRVPGRELAGHRPASEGSLMDPVVHLELPHGDRKGLHSPARRRARSTAASISVRRTGQHPSVVVGVRSIGMAIGRIGEAGERVLGKPMLVANIGRCASFLDTRGNRLGMLQPLAGRGTVAACPYEPRTDACAAASRAIGTR